MPRTTQVARREATAKCTSFPAKNDLAEWVRAEMIVLLNHQLWLVESHLYPKPW